MSVPLEDVLKDLDARRRNALAMGGRDRLAQRKAQGVLTARERIDPPAGAIAAGDRGTTAPRAAFPATPDTAIRLPRRVAEFRKGKAPRRLAPRRGGRDRSPDRPPVGC